MIFQKTFSNANNDWVNEITVFLSEKLCEDIVNVRGIIKANGLKSAAIEPPSDFLEKGFNPNDKIRSLSLYVLSNEVILKCEGCNRHEYAEYRPMGNFR
mgnify:CR=1 FL=1